MLKKLCALCAGAALLICFLLPGCGGGGGGSSTILTTVPDTQLTSSTPDGRLVLAQLPDGFHGDTTVTLTATPHAYFGQNSLPGQGGHFALVVHGDAVQIGQAVRGHGLVLGCVAGAVNGNPVCPSSQLETWFNGQALTLNGQTFTDNLLLTAAQPVPLLIDEVPITVSFYSHLSPDCSTRTVRYLLWQGSTVYDSGVLNDPNTLFDCTKNAVILGDVFAAAGAVWSIDLTNITITQD